MTFDEAVQDLSLEHTAKMVNNGIGPYEFQGHCETDNKYEFEVDGSGDNQVVKYNTDDLALFYDYPAENDKVCISMDTFIGENEDKYEYCLECYIKKITVSKVENTGNITFFDVEITFDWEVTL